jgi:hypothetical protein
MLLPVSQEFQCTVQGIFRAVKDMPGLNKKKEMQVSGIESLPKHNPVKSS